MSLITFYLCSRLPVESFVLIRATSTESKANNPEHQKTAKTHTPQIPGDAFLLSAQELEGWDGAMVQGKSLQLLVGSI